MGTGIVEGSSKNHRSVQEQIHHLFRCCCFEKTREVMSADCGGVSHPWSGKKIRVRRDEVYCCKTNYPQTTATPSNRYLPVPRGQEAAVRCSGSGSVMRLRSPRGSQAGGRWCPFLPRWASQEMCSLLSRRFPLRDRERSRRQKSLRKKRLPSFITCAQRRHTTVGEDWTGAGTAGGGDHRGCLQGLRLLNGDIQYQC